MQQNSEKFMEDSSKKLMTVVIALTLLVVTLFGLAPSA